MGMVQKEDHVSVDESADESTDDLPSPEDCITHLKLMTAFSYLKDDITESTDLFLTEAELADSYKEDRRSTLKEKRWTVYISRAVQRFERWATTFVKRQKEKGSNGSQNAEISSDRSMNKSQDQSEHSSWVADDLPPLDVLLVFHAYMLNPRWFLDDCLRLKWMSLWNAGMPWHLLEQCIDGDTFMYDVPESTKTAFSRTGLHWNNLEDSNSELLRCSICSSQNDRNQQPSNNEWLSHPEFALLCTLPCRDPAHLWQIQVDNLRTDLEEFNARQIPLRATFLDHRGRVPDKDPVKRPPRDFTARLLSDKTNRSALDQARSKPAAGNIVATIFDNADHSIKASTFTIRKLKSDRLSSAISFAERYSLSRARIAYGESTCLPFSIDLTSAVLRQGKFVDSMRELSWIFAPNLHRTVENLLAKYVVFLDVMRESRREEICVPTLAVDLAWHTHQLSPQKYLSYTVSEVNGLFVDHDDRVDEGDLEPAFKRTSERFKEMTDGGVYGECMCWHCAALDLHARELGSKSNNSAEVESDKLKEDGAERRTQIEQRAAWTVSEFQRRKFDHDYERHRRRNGNEKQNVDRVSFLQDYTWPYPDYVPVNVA